ncbi:MAG: glycosyltransferase [Candidatus Omnitrophica bacterium]|nr:glycosyltransferase [Candidatus Omnitrophota bacterium]
MLNIVIPVYNEPENIKDTFTELAEKVKTPHSTFIIYDLDEDKTLPVVRDFMKSDQNINLVKNKYGRGVLGAIKTGFENIDEGVILVAMADLSDDFSKVDEMFKKIDQGYGLVCGSRYMKEGRQIGGPILKKTLSRLAGISLYYLAGLPTHDPTNNFKMYTKKLLDDITIESKGGFEIAIEIVVKAHCKGYKITEVPIISQDRKVGKSRFKLFKWLPKYLYWYFVALKNRFKIKKR